MMAGLRVFLTKLPANCACVVCVWCDVCGVCDVHDVCWRVWEFKCIT